jgi:myosin heavy subunit
MRTAAATYRSSSLETLRGPSSGGTHFVRCIRADLTRQPKGFQHEVVRQQLRALAVLNTAQARQKGYPHRIPFHEFIHRYGSKKQLQLLCDVIWFQGIKCADVFEVLTAVAMNISAIWDVISFCLMKVNNISEKI